MLSGITQKKNLDTPHLRSPETDCSGAQRVDEKTVVCCSISSTTRQVRFSRGRWSLGATPRKWANFSLS